VKARDWWLQVSVQVAGTLIAAAVVYLVVVIAGVVTLNVALAIVAALVAAASLGLAGWRVSRPMSEEERAARLAMLEAEVDYYRYAAEASRRDTDAGS
jgi:hypothetical protein